jgi:uncharacterized protein (DUF433 family)
MANVRITTNPSRMRGLPCIRDTRVTVSAVLGQLAAGASLDELLASYPYLEREDVLATLRYAAAKTYRPSRPTCDLKHRGAGR